MTPVGCLLLTMLAPILMQEVPQRVERITEIHWCQETDAFFLRQIDYLRVDRSPTRLSESTIDLHEIPRPREPRESTGP